MRVIPFAVFVWLGDGGSGRGGVRRRELFTAHPLFVLVAENVLANLQCLPANSRG